MQLLAEQEWFSTNSISSSLVVNKGCSSLALLLSLTMESKCSQQVQPGSFSPGKLGQFLGVLGCFCCHQNIERILNAVPCPSSKERLLKMLVKDYFLNCQYDPHST